MDELEDVEIHFEDILSRVDARKDRQSKQSKVHNFIENLPSNIRYTWDRFLDIRWKIRDQYHRITRGYADQDWYEYAYNNSRRTVILLTKLRNSKHLSAPYSNFSKSIPMPNEEPSQDTLEWKSKIDDMIFYHMCISGQYEEMDPNYNSMIPCEDLYYIKDPEARKRFRRGKYFYYKYYDYLWD